MIVNELRTEALTAPSSPAHTHRAEFVEFRVLSGGDLYGLRVFIYRGGAGGWVPTEFAFPSTVVRAGEYVVVHLRTLEHMFIDAYPSAHNFWLPGSASRLNKNGAVYVLDGEGRVLTAVMVSEGSDPSWWGVNNRAHFARIAEFLFAQGAWRAPGGGVATPADAVALAGTGSGVTWSVSRDESAPDSGTAADWRITGATPGRPNQP